MNRIFWALFLIMGCQANNCFEKSSVYPRFKQIFERQRTLIRSQDDLKYLEGIEKTEQSLFSKVCEHLGSNTKLMVVEEVPLFNKKQRHGIVYLYDSDTSLYFSTDKKGEIVLEKGQHNFFPMEKVLAIVSDDYLKMAPRLTEYFDKKIVYDVSGLSLFMLDAKDTSNSTPFYGFRYLPKVILSEEFDKEFLIKWD